MALEFKQIENQKDWDGFVLEQERYSFVQSWAYTFVLEALVSSIKRIGVYNNDKLIGLLPLGVIRAKRGNYLRLRHGPILNEDGWLHFDKIINFLSDYSKQRGLNFIRIQPIDGNSAALQKFGFKVAPTHNLDAEHTLQLTLKNENIDSLMAKMRKNTRYYIRKGLISGIEMIKDNSRFEDFYTVLKATAKRQNYTTWPREYFENEFKYYGSENLNLYIGYLKDKPISIGLFLDYGKYRFYLEGGMLPQYSELYPSYAIQYTSIKEAVEKGLEIYDFWGGVSPKDQSGQEVKNYPWAGIDLFKRGFGGVEVNMVHPHDLPLNWQYWTTWMYESMEKKKRGY